MTPPAPASPEISLTGRIERITYQNRDNHFTIARLRTDENRRAITVKGIMPAVRIGESIAVRGRWETHARYGQQLTISAYRVQLPATVDGIRSYLSSGFIKGVGSKLVDRIVAHFRADTLNVIENAPDRLAEVRGVGEKTAQRLAEAWRTHHAARRLMRFLEENSVDTIHAARLLKEYGTNAVDILCNDPYRVAKDLPRIGFRIADAIVRNADTPMDEMDRAGACVRHLFERAVDQGHTYIARQPLLEQCRKSFDVDKHIGRQALDHLIEAGELVARTVGGPAASDPIFPRALDQAEATIARRITAMQQIAPNAASSDRQSMTEAVLQRLAITLSPTQSEILAALMAHKLAIITGGPGTGKTTLIRAICVVVERLGHRVMLSAPTGRAARRLADVTGRPAATLHRLLGYNLSDGRFERNQDDPLDAEVIIVDEASMVDTPLMAHLIGAVPVTARLILVGDVFQLPSVGPGNVLADLIRSQRIVTYELKEIFRQEHQSRIVINAHRVRSGQLPVIDPVAEADGYSDFHFFHQADPEKAAAAVVDLCHREIPRHFRLDPIREIQVLTPMHRGLVGTLHLNRVLQEALNPGDEQVSVSGRRYKVGDKVMHLRNNYRKAVFNGDIGIVTGIDPDNARAEVDYDGRRVDYDFLELDELALAYAISVHKSQGSEYPAVVIPLLTQHYVMLQRNLLYTALTRGKQLVVIVGTTRALDVALRNDRPRQRRSMLARRLNPALTR